MLSTIPNISDAGKIKIIKDLYEGFIEMKLTIDPPRPFVIIQATGKHDASLQLTKLPRTGNNIVTLFSLSDNHLAHAISATTYYDRIDPIDKTIECVAIMENKSKKEIYQRQELDFVIRYINYIEEGIKFITIIVKNIDGFTSKAIKQMLNTVLTKLVNVAYCLWHNLEKQDNSLPLLTAAKSKLLANIAKLKTFLEPHNSHDNSNRCEVT